MKYLILFSTWVVMIQIQAQSIRWENFNLTDENAITSGSKFTSADQVSITLNWFVNAHNGFVHAANSGADFVSYEADSRVQGGENGIVSISFDNNRKEPADRIVIQLEFSKPVFGLRLPLLDVDAAVSGFDDFVEIYYNDSLNVRETPYYKLGRCVKTDNEDFGHGFEGETDNCSGGALPKDSAGNIYLHFYDTEVRRLTIVYFTGDDNLQADPGFQIIALGDLFWDQALPVSLIAFDALLNPRQEVVLDWSTAQEIQADYFEIMHSTDGKYFESLGKINASGSTTQIKNYQFIHTLPVLGDNYYRLDEYDLDGLSSPLPLRHIYVKPATQKLVVSPNPTHQIIRVNTTGLGPQDISIYDAQGQQLYTKHFTQPLITHEINVQSFMNGLYVLRITNDEGVHSAKFIKG